MNKFKIITIIAVATTITNLTLPAVAEPLENINIISNETQVGNDLKQTTLATLEETQVENSKGQIELDLYFDMPIVDGEGFTVSLLSSDNSVLKTFKLEKDTESNLVDVTIEKRDRVKQLQSEDAETYFYYIKMDKIENGDYTVKIEGEGYETFTSKVSIDSTSKRLLIGNTSATIGEQNIPAAFLAGDVNGDGVVDENDYEIVFNGRGNSDINPMYDLNKDGKVDIVDLTLVRKNIGKTKEEATIINTYPIIDIDKVKVELPAGTSLKGDATVEDLFVDNGKIVGLESGNGVISNDNPISMDIKLSDDPQEVEKIIIYAPSGNAPTSGVVVVGGVEYQFDNTESTESRSKLIDVSDSIVINLGKQVAISEITIRITGSKSNTNLAEIAKVELLNNVYSEIPAPQLNIPNITSIVSNIDVYGGILDVNWESQGNVTGYELTLQEVDSTGKEKSKTTYKTQKTSLRLEKLKSYATYRLSVQSLNGDWKSGIKEATVEDVDGIPENVNSNYEPIEWEPDNIVEFKIIPGTKPDPSEGLSVKEAYKALNISWSANKKALEQKIEYRKLGETEWNSTKWLTGTSYRLEGLDENCTYEIRMKALNHLGEGAYSVTYLGVTTGVKLPNIPAYGLINRSNGFGVKSEGIEDVSYTMLGGSYLSDKFAIVDNDGGSYYNLGNWYGVNTGPTVTFEKEETIDRIAIVERLDIGTTGIDSATGSANVEVWDEKESKFQKHKVSVTKYNGYYMFVLDEPVTTKKIKVNWQKFSPVTAANGWVTVSEMKFYNYGTVDKEIANLFVDNLQLELKSDVTLEKIEELERRVNVVDGRNFEYHPQKANLLKEIARAKELYLDVNLTDDVITVDTSIQNGNTALSISNGWQSLGYAVRSGDEIAVYVGSSDTSRKIELAVRQNFAESGAYVSTPIVLQPGKNIITIPKINSLDAENGGNLYVRTTWNNESSTPNIKVRVSGATKVPLLDLNNIIGNEDAMKEEIRSYIRELKDFVAVLPSMYPTEEDKTNNIYKYDERTSILNNTDIEGDRFTLTVPATQALKGIVSGSSTEEEQVQSLYNSIMAWEQFVEMTYAKKGVYEEPIDFNGDGTIDADEKKEFDTNRAPRTRINIKYQRMFAGAAAYASSDHIGIQYDLVPSLMQGVPFNLDEAGNVTNPDEGKFFGWLIAHEMGHVVDITKRTYSETSNNILSLMSQTFDGEDMSRLEESGVYKKIYDKVTSGATGISSDVFVSLGMFWQLQLAYENGTVSQMLVNNYDTNRDNDSYYAKVNRLYRTLSTDMQTLDKDQLMIRISSDAAQKDLTDYFKAWGIIATDATKVYLSKYEKESRAIQYLNDEAKRKQLAGDATMETDTEVIASFKDSISSTNRLNNNQVQLSLNVTKSNEDILGYEIYVNGEVAGFVEKEDGETIYTHSFNALNNRVFKFEVKAYDYNLNSTEKVDLGTIKVMHDGTISKANWTLSSNESILVHSNTSNDNLASTLESIMDKNDSTYSTINKTTVDPYVVIDLGKNTPIVGLKYTAPLVENTNFLTRLFSDKKLSQNPLSKYEIQVSTDGITWTSVNTGTLSLSVDKPSDTVYFNKPGTTGGNQYWMQNVQYVKLIGKSASAVDIAEIELLSPVGDNIEIGVDNNDDQYKNGIGKLKTDYEYAPGKVIPSGSIIITGEYKGNPIYNIPLVLDEEGSNIASDAKAIILAELPEGTVPTEVAEGNWIYWIEPQYIDDFKAKSIKANLYRVNNFETLEGQRLVSDTFYIDVPSILPEIELNVESKSSFEFDQQLLNQTEEQINE